MDNIFYAEKDTEYFCTDHTTPYTNIPLSEMRYYRKALRDVYNWFDTRSVSIKGYKIGNYDCMMAFLKMFIENPDPLMELGDMARYKEPPIVEEKINKYFENKKKRKQGE